MRRFSLGYSRLIVSQIFVVIALSGCYYKETPLGYANVRLYNKDSLEIEIPYKVKGRGNIHNIDLKKFEFNGAEWFYVRNKKKLVSGDSLICSIEKRMKPTDYIYIESLFRGNIEIFDSLLVIKLENPYYKDGKTIDHWEHYKFNGTYKLNRLDSVSKS